MGGVFFVSMGGNDPYRISTPFGYFVVYAKIPQKVIVPLRTVSQTVLHLHKKDPQGVFFIWCRWEGTILRPQLYECCALTN